MLIDKPWWNHRIFPWEDHQLSLSRFKIFYDSIMVYQTTWFRKMTYAKFIWFYGPPLFCGPQRIGKRRTVSPKKGPPSPKAISTHQSSRPPISSKHPSDQDWTEWTHWPVPETEAHAWSKSTISHRPEWNSWGKGPRCCTQPQKCRNDKSEVPATQSHNL